ncbi:MAG: CoA activase [Bacteroidales bacterium]|nr:CoA activase [Bacteroidales bacterium]
MEQDTTLRQPVFMGIDIGSISVNIVILNQDKSILAEKYIYCQGRPFHALSEGFKEVMATFSPEQISLLAYTGTGGKLAAELTGGLFVNEIIAQSASASELYPQVRTIIEMGGEDSKLIFMDEGVDSPASSLSDFAMNALCAAGTGSFLDQQASRLGLSIINEFGDLALKSEQPPRIAGRCSVFAKSDMIHLQQVATPVHDIVAGLCFAVARNLKSTLGRGKHFSPPVLFNGGVAANKGMVRAFRDVLDMTDGQLIVSDHHASMGALGAVYHALENGSSGTSFTGLEKLEAYLVSDQRQKLSHQQLTDPGTIINKEVFPLRNGNVKTGVYLGVDVGSLSTNVVLIDEKNRVVARRYLPTAGKPLEAIKQGISEIYDEAGDKVEVLAAGTTGSGRYLTGDFIGADAIRNEITAQATAAIAHDPGVDTIFEIGGQDSKYIRIQNGVVIDFEMNKVCAAGTGSFLEEQAEKLGINIIGEFGDLALSSTSPSRLGDRCTVFMESDLNSCSQKGEPVENLVGGLAYSIVHNYLNRVVGNKPVGNRIFFQGGVTNNKSVVAAFEQVTGKKITVPPHFDVTGAIGAAILARESMTAGQKTRFKGFSIRNRKYETDHFECKRCNNHCEIRRVRVEGERKPLYYGGRCDYYDVVDRKGKGKDIPDYFAEREKLLIGDYEPVSDTGRISIGIPRGLMVYYQQFQMWSTFFGSLGFNVIVSDKTSKSIITKSLETMVAETCYPVEVMHGHILDLVEKGADYIFTPFIVNAAASAGNPTSNCNCPWIQTYSFLLRSAFHGREEVMEKMLVPVLHFRYDRVVRKELAGFMKEKFNISARKTSEALNKAYEAQRLFEERITVRGKEVMKSLPEGKQAMVIIGRPYNSGDSSLNLDLVEKLIRMDIVPIPLDFLPLKDENIFDDYKGMYWPNGQKILSGARIIARDKRLYGVYTGNFRCGPDSFLQHFVHREMKGKPFLHLEVDEHSADAGMITRIEAFLDSLKGYAVQSEQTEVRKPAPVIDSAKQVRTLYFPYMNDSAHLISAACRACGTPSEVLPMQTSREIELARKYTTGTECFPMICTTGSFLKKLQEPGIDPSKVSFFMPDHNGPCRFGEYNKLQKHIFERIGLPEVEIISPSNDTSYAEMPVDNPVRFRLLAWKGFVAGDFLRKMVQEKRPYEAENGRANEVYKKYLAKLTVDIEKGAHNLAGILKEAADEFDTIPLVSGERKPVVAVVGEIFMRDNHFCSGRLVERLESMGAETLIMPFSEWLLYSTYRYIRDSKWKRSLKGLIKANVQKFSQSITAEMVSHKVKNRVDKNGLTHIGDILKYCYPYIHKDYDGDPPLSLGNVALLSKGFISGVANILPFTCMPGTIISAVSETFRKDHDDLPWVNIAYDGQEDTALDSRLQAFMFQAREYRVRKSEFKQPVNTA